MTLAQLAIILFTVTSTSITAGSSSELQWKSHYGTAKRSAQAAKRPLVVVIENSDEASLKIDEGSLDGESREKLAKEDFELVKVDANTAYGKRVANAFGVQQFPYIAVTDDISERIVYRKSGPMSQSDWTLALAKSAETKSLTIEKVVVQKPIVSEVRSVEVYPVVAQNQPASYAFPSQTPVTQPNPNVQPQVQQFMPTQMFAPNGFYQMPASQCFT